MGHELLARGQAQGVQKLGAAKGFAHNLRFHRGVVVVHDVVRPQQHIALPVFKCARQGAFTHIAQLTHRGADPNMPIHFAQRGGCENAVADEVGHKTGGRAVVQAVSVVPLVQLAMVHHTDHITNGKGLQLVVRDEQGRGFGRLQDVAHFVGQALSQVHIEVGKRFIQQQQIGPWGQRTRQGHPLLLATRKLVGKALVRTFQADQSQHLGHALLALGFGQVRQTKADVAAHVHVGKQCVILEHHADAAALSRFGVVLVTDHSVGQQDLPAR